jgi:hypothetical protein
VKEGNVMVLTIVYIILQAFCLFLLASVVFDLVHLMLHRCLKSRYTMLRKLGEIHLPHHRFYSSGLQINTEYTRANLFSHTLFENAVQLMVILLGFLVFNHIAVYIVLLFQLFLFINVCWSRGVDQHHQPYKHIPAYGGGFFVSAPYHALHHHYVSSHFSSYIKIIDCLFGTAHQLAKKNIVMTGAGGALGAHMKTMLEKEGATVTCFKFGTDYDYEHYDKLIPALQQADILFLCHGSKLLNAQQANCDSYVKIIELYKQVRPRGLLPLEVWATGSEIECHPCFGIKSIQIYAASKRNYAKYARAYYADPDIQYRHLVHSAFMSKMGPGLMSAKFAAFCSLFFIKRGFRYVPVTYTGFAWLNYVRFFFNV